MTSIRIATLFLLFIAASVISSCTKDEIKAKETPKITTTAVTDISSTFATSGVELSGDGGSAVLSKGIVWSTSPNPTIDLATRTSNGTGTTSVTDIMKPLQPSTKYYVRAYATNEVGTAYGSEVSFTTLTKGVCRLDRWVNTKYDCCTDISYLFRYTATNQIDYIEQQVASGAGWSAGTIYKHVFKGDSTYIYFSNVTSKANLNITVASDAKGVASVKRYFVSTGGTYRYTFDYSVASRVTITLDYIGNYGAYTQKSQTGVYYFDEKGNVTRFEKSFFDFSGTLTGYQDTRYTYDQSENPVRGLIAPFFNSQSVPLVAYFSVNNKVSETISGTTTTSVLQYASTGMPSQYTYWSPLVAAPGTAIGKYTYVNCN